MVSLQLSKDRLLCSICLDVFRDPVSLSCGHNFCMACINSHWFKITWNRYRCPLCRKEFATRPYPEKNTLLGDIAGEFRQAQKRAIPPPLLPSEVPCDWCPTTAQRKAIKSCLRCLASFCPDHLQPHLRAEGAFADHPLEEPLQDLLTARKCPTHGRLLELYCRRERCFLCALCAFGDHEEHKPVQLDEEARRRKVDLAAIQMDEKKRLKEADRNREEVRKYLEDVKHHALSSELHASTISRMITRLEELQNDAEKYFKTEENMTLEKISGCLKEMKEENVWIRDKIFMLQDLQESCDHFKVVQESESLKADTGPLVSPLLKVDSVSRMRGVDRMLSQLLDGIEKTLENSFVRRLLHNCAGNVELPFSDADEDTASEYVFRLYSAAFKDVQKYLVSITLDSKTAHEYLQIADGSKIVSNISPGCVSCPNLPERFEAKGQVMCTERFFKGQFYWEVKFSVPKVGIGLTYGSIGRKGSTRSSFIGKNSSSWCLVVDGKTCRAWHNGVFVAAGTLKSSVLGVFLNYSAGLLDFYSIRRGSLTLVHRFQASFVEPVYPAFWVGQRAALMLCH
ncbi:tripartite motif-containing protein 16 isoform X2 [Microcaecilia unicolor]|uniref:Tripartite motif-containing protein 16-like isoform X2 n=1 Tax=Microcaecilia unicolor TaxID=1415580 RepID=A0A6P7YGE1_9AMPH|nr:tripartite motif-containing protein 16-like isoform X2 [Microcaecilia unicolor]